MMKNPYAMIMCAVALNLSLACAPTNGAAPAAGAAAGASDTSAGADVLGFVRDGWIWLADGNGTAPQRLVQGEQPALRPDGGAIAYRELRDYDRFDARDAQLNVLDLESRQTRIVIQPGEILSFPCWAPDGRHLAFLLTFEGGEPQINRIDADGANRRPILRGGEQDVYSAWEMSWTPDGRALFFHDMRQLVWLSPDGEVLERTPIGAVLGGGEERITSSDRFAQSPADPEILVCTKSVKGTPIFEKAIDEPNTALFLHDRRVGAERNRRLTPEDVTAFAPAWSADGQRVYFCGYRDTQAKERDPFRIYRVNIDGGGLTEITRGQDPTVAAKQSGEAPGVVTAEKAIEAVARLPEVAGWMKQVAEAAGRSGQNNRAAIEIADEEPERFVIRAFEIVQDDDTMSHTATFGWYAVDKATGAASSIMDEMIGGAEPDVAEAD